MVEGRRRVALKLPTRVRNANISKVVEQLKDLHESLCTVEQDEFPQMQEELLPVAKRLVDSELINSSDKAIRLLVACCLANILCLFAPEAPYTAVELKDIFKLFIQQLKTLSDEKNVYQSYVFYLVESLATVKSIVLLLDIDDGKGERERLLQQLFGLLFDLAPLPTVSKTAKLYLLEIGQTLIDESDVVSLDIVAFIVQKCGDIRGETQKFATALLQACADKLQPAIGLLFSERLLSDTHDHAGDGDDRSVGRDRKRWEGIRLVHSQVLQVGKVAPSALVTVIPQLEDELQADDQELRLIAINCVGQLFSTSKGSVQKMYTGLWQAWVNKVNDKASAVRLLWLKAALELLPSLEVSFKDTLQVAVCEKLQDIDAKVRERCLQLLAKYMEDGNSVSHLGLAVAEEVGNRCRDKHEDVRIAAMTVFCQIIRKIHEIPGLDTWLTILVNILFKLIYTNDRDLRIFYEYFLEHSFMTPMGDLDVHARFLASSYRCLDEEAHRAFKKWLGDKSLFVRYFEAYLKLAVANLDDPRLATINQHLSNLFRVPLDALAMLQALPQVIFNNKDYQSLLSQVPSINTPLAKLKEITTVIIDEDWTRSDARLKTFLMTFMVRRGALLSINGDIITAILGITDRELLPYAQKLVADIISDFPALGVKHAKLMEEAVCQYSDDLNSLVAFARFANSCAAKLSPSEAFFTILSHLIMNGSRKQVKLAVRIVKPFTTALANLVAIFKDSIATYGSLEGMQLVRFWQVMAELASTRAFDVTNESFRHLFDSCMAPLLDIKESWATNRDSSLLDLCKSEEICGVLAIRSLRNALLALKNVDRNAELEQLRVWAPKLLEWLVGLRSSRVQLAAVKALTCLVPRPTAQTFVVNLCPMIQYFMHCPTILRDRLNSFILRQYQMGSIGMILLLLPILSLSMNSAVGRNTLKESLLNIRRNDRFADPLPVGERTLTAIDSHSITRYEDWLIISLIILALAPPFEQLTEASIVKLNSTLELLSDIVLSEYNISYIFEAAVQLKRYRFVGERGRRNRHLYVLSELTQQILRHRASAHRWALEAITTTIAIGDELLREIDGIEEMHKNVQRPYLDRLNRKSSQSTAEHQLEPVAKKAADSAEEENRISSSNTLASSSSVAGSLQSTLKKTRLDVRRSSRNKSSVGDAYVEL